MKRAAHLLMLLALLQCSLPETAHSSETDNPARQLTFRVADHPLLRDVPRIGVNLGSRTSWGAEQLMANVLANPGFEPTLDGAIVCVRKASGDEFTDDTTWLKRSDHFWTQAGFSIRTGRLAGVSGRIMDSGAAEGYPQFRADRDLTGLVPGDVVALSRLGGPGLPSQWWWENASRNRVRTDPSHPPHSPGTQSLLLAPDDAQPVAAVSYLDMIFNRAGKLLPLSGEWEVRFWAKSAAGGQLSVQCKRLNAPAFLHQTVSPGAEWREFRFPFTPHDSAPAAGLEFRLQAKGAGARIWIDDVSLAPVGAPPSGFRREVVETLRQLHPGYLRDWQGQIGDSFANRLAVPGARRPFRYRPGDEAAFGYSLPEFLQLCREIGAQPWVVLPTTLSDKEWSAAGAYLHAALANYGFREIVVEFGNENWNAIFRPAGIMDAQKMAEAGQRGFRLLKAASGGDRRILPALGAQFVNPSPIRHAAPSAPDARLIAVAPYYAQSLKQPGVTNELLPQLFPDDAAAFQQYAELAAQSGKETAIYEMNAHSLRGDAATEEVSRLVSSAAAGSAILYRSLMAMESGIRRQCLYSLSGFDTLRQDGKLVRLFGLSRDLAAPGHLRPTGLAMAMANQLVAGDSYKVTPLDPKAPQRPPVRIVAFRGGGRWGVVAASASPEKLQITIEFPPGTAAVPTVLVQMTSASPWSGNESGNEVVLRRSPLHAASDSISFQLPPYGSGAAYSEPPGVSIRNSIKVP